MTVASERSEGAWRTARGDGVPASEPAGESEGQSPSDETVRLKPDATSGLARRRDGVAHRDELGHRVDVADRRKAAELGELQLRLSHPVWVEDVDLLVAGHDLLTARRLDVLEQRLIDWTRAEGDRDLGR